MGTKKAMIIVIATGLFSACGVEDGGGNKKKKALNEKLAAVVTGEAASFTYQPIVYFRFDWEVGNVEENIHAMVKGPSDSDWKEKDALECPDRFYPIGTFFETTDECIRITESGAWSFKLKQGDVESDVVVKEFSIELTKSKIVANKGPAEGDAFEFVEAETLCEFSYNDYFNVNIKLEKHDLVPSTHVPVIGLFFTGIVKTEGEGLEPQSKTVTVVDDSLYSSGMAIHPESDLLPTNVSFTYQTSKPYSYEGEAIPSCEITVEKANNQEGYQGSFDCKDLLPDTNELGKVFGDKLNISGDWSCDRLF
jgi:hypothetical protein